MEQFVDNEDLIVLVANLGYVVLAIALLVVAKLVKDRLTPYRIDEELTAKDNPALGLTMAGYFLGVVIIFIGAAHGPGPDAPPTAGAVLATMGGVTLYVLAGIAALNFGRWALDKLLLNRFSTVKEIIEDRNVGTGAVEAGNYVATALIVAGAIHGEGGGPLTAGAFFALGVVALAIFARLYQWATPYDLHTEIERDNVAAGAAFGMSLVALGAIVMHGAHGDFVSWGENLTWFAIDAAIGFVLLLALRLVTDVLFLPKSTLRHEIAVDQNLSAAWMEGALALGVAALVFALM